MGKNIRVQRRGRGSFQFRAPTHRRISSATYLSLPPEKTSFLGTVKDIIHEPARGAPLAKIRYEDGRESYVAAPEGISVGQSILMTSEPAGELGNIMPLGKISEGTFVCNVEAKPGDGGKIARASGTYALIVAHTPSGTEVRLPSGKTVYMNDNCRAMIGVIAGAGRTERPFIKAGTKFHLMAIRGRKWPVVKGQAMVAASHPFGGGRHKHAGKPTTVGRDAPPGKKVGMIAARQTGRAKRRAR